MYLIKLAVSAYCGYIRFVFTASRLHSEMLFYRSWLYSSDPWDQFHFPLTGCFLSFWTLLMVVVWRAVCETHSACSEPFSMLCICFVAAMWLADKLCVLNKHLDILPNKAVGACISNNVVSKCLWHSWKVQICQGKKNKTATYTKHLQLYIIDACFSSLKKGLCLWQSLRCCIAQLDQE